jgi:hypothetical protein
MKTTRMNASPIFTFAVAGTAWMALAACSDKPKANIKTLETAKAQAAVDAYDKTGSDALKAQAEKAFLDLDGEIKELEIRVDATTGEQRAEADRKLTELRKRSAEIRADFNAAKFNTLIQDIKDSVR